MQLAQIKIEIGKMQIKSRVVSSPPLLNNNNKWYICETLKLACLLKSHSAIKNKDMKSSL